MLQFIVRRLLLVIPQLLAVSLVVFFFLRLSGAEPALAYLKASSIPLTHEAIADANHQLGLDRPLWEQYFTWLGNAVQLDFGISYMNKRDVLDQMLYYLPATLKLSTFALTLTLLISIPLAVWAARYRNKWPDFAIRGLAFVGVSIPNFWLAFILVMLFSIQLKWLPAMGYGSFSNIILPGIAIAFMSLAINARLLRASMLEVAGQRHVRYARIRGITERTIERNHIFRNSLLPIITAVGMHVGEMIGGSLVIESIFSWPGVGRYAITAIGQNDYPVIQCFVIMMTAILIFCNLIIDILYAWLDPRIRLESK